MSSRKPERKTERIPVLMTPSDVKQLEEVRFATRVSSRAEVIRRLIHKGLESVTLVER
jgi:hypothetical protein